MHIAEINEVKPFLKWAGGKSWLIKDYRHLFPTNYQKYIEPFLGGGALFFGLEPRIAVLSDCNKELIETYLAIRDDWQLVSNLLKGHSERHNDEYYYHVRGQNIHDIYESAARFIYLNRTCWNGLYRVNRDGKFNVPRGTKNSVIMSSDDFGSISQLLKRVELASDDFSSAMAKAGPGDFVFLDPPYVTGSDAKFKKYNGKVFDNKDLKRLFVSIEEARYKGAKIIMTYHDPVIVEEYFGHSVTIFTVERRDTLAGKISGRGLYQESIVRF
jgi:DNA adenine methylase